MRAEQQRARRGIRAGRTAEWFAAESTRASSPAASARSWNQLRAAGVRLGERRPRDPSVGRCADLRQSIEVGAHAVGVDAERHRGDATAVAEPSRGRVHARTVDPADPSRHETDSVTAHRRCHAVVMRDNECRRATVRRGPSRCNAIRIASTGTPSRRYWPRRRPSRSKPNDSYSAIAGSFHGNTWSSSLLTPTASAHVDRLSEQRAADTAPAVARGDHQAEIGDMAARRVDVAGEREPRRRSCPPSSATKTAASGCRRTARR